MLRACKYISSGVLPRSSKFYPHWAVWALAANFHSIVSAWDAFGFRDGLRKATYYPFGHRNYSHGGTGIALNGMLADERTFTWSQWFRYSWFWFKRWARLMASKP